MPDGNSELMLVAARLRHVAGTKWGSRRYLDMEHLLAPERRQEVAASSAAACLAPRGKAALQLKDDEPLDLIETTNPLN